MNPLRRCLASPSSGKPDALPLHNVKLSENSCRADRPINRLYRRSRFTPSHTALARTRDLQTDIFHRIFGRPSQTQLGGAGRDRTDGLMLAKHALSQLSYSPVAAKPRRSQKSELGNQNF